MASKNFRGVIFDLFGTLIKNLDRHEFEETLARIARVLSVNPLDFIRIWNETWRQRSIGSFGSLEQDIEHISRVLGTGPRENALYETAQLLRDLAAKALHRTRNDAVQTLTALKTRGFKTGLISNCAANIPSVWQDGPLARLIDAPTFSCSVGIRKPDNEVYDLTSRKLALSPDQCFYIADGNERELTGASQAGLQPILFKGPDVDPYDKGLDRKEWTGPTISKLSHLFDVLGQSRSEHELIP